MYTRFSDVLAETAARQGDRPAVTYDGVTTSYADLWDDVLAVAGGLHRLGLRRNDRVAVYLEKRTESVVAIYAASEAGGVFVPVNPVLRPRQVEHILSDCDVRVLITSPERLQVLADDVRGCAALEHVVVLGAPPALDPPPSFTVSGWDGLRSAGAGHRAGEAIDIDMAGIFYTSGSTGRPKGVVVSHRNLVVGGQSVSGYLANTCDDVLLAVLPLAFDAGFSQLTTGFNVGAHVVLMNFRFPAEVVRLCERHHVTGLTCVPPLWSQLADQTWPPEATAAVRYIANTGGRMPKALLDRLRTIFEGARPFLMYGLTEAFRSTYLDPAEVDRRPHSIGKAIPNAEILVVRPDGSATDAGEEGELVHRGALVALGYWNDTSRTAERFRPAPGGPPGLRDDVAVWSGDLVVRDEEGFLTFVGRRDDMIKTSGYRVSPTEVEEVVHATGMVADAAAFGVDDERLGQRIVLVVSPPEGRALDSEALSGQLRAQLPLYMVPQTILVRPQLPRSPNGKLDRTLLRQELAT